MNLLSNPLKKRAVKSPRNSSALSLNSDWARRWLRKVKQQKYHNSGFLSPLNIYALDYLPAASLAWKVTLQYGAPLLPVLPGLG